MSEDSLDSARLTSLMTKAEALEIAKRCAVAPNLFGMMGDLTQERRGAFFGRCRDALDRSIRSTKSCQKRKSEKKKERRKTARTVRRNMAGL